MIHGAVAHMLFSKHSVFSLIDESELSASQPLRDSGGGVRSNGPGILPAVLGCQDLLASARIYYSLNEEMRVCGKVLHNRLFHYAEKQQRRAPPPNSLNRSVV